MVFYKLYILLQGIYNIIILCNYYCLFSLLLYYCLIQICKADSHITKVFCFKQFVLNKSKQNILFVV